MKVQKIINNVFTSMFSVFNFIWKKTLKQTIECLYFINSRKIIRTQFCGQMVAI